MPSSSKPSAADTTPDPVPATAPLPDDPAWLRWSRDLQAIAQSGLAYTPSHYDRERFEQLRDLASEIMARYSATPAPVIRDLFAAQTGYATPKIDVRGAVFNPAGELLLVREVADGGRWTLPGGWADVNYTPAESVLKEIREESGFKAEVTKVAAVLDRTRQGHTHAVFSCTKLFFLCRLVGGTATPSSETSEVAWFAEPDLPADLSTGRVLPRQLHRLFAHLRHPEYSTDWD